MSNFLTVLVALLLEQVKPLNVSNPLRQQLAASAERLMLRFASPGGSSRASPALGWALLVIAPALLAWGVSAMLARHSFWLALLFNIVVLYLCLGFRRFSHHFTLIRKALDEGRTEDARQELAQWLALEQSDQAAPNSAGEIVSLATLRATAAAHRHVFGALLWFMLPFGPGGVVAYRLADFAARRWPGSAEGQSLAARAFALMDYVPVRVTVLALALVSHFERVAHSWRLFQQHKPAAALSPAEGDLLLATVVSHAVNIRLPGALSAPEEKFEEPGVEHLDAVDALAWRTVALALALLALIAFAQVTR